LRAGNVRDFCIEVHEEKSGEWLYTLRVRGDEFRAPVRRAVLYSTRVFDPDGSYERHDKHLAALKRG
jgi:hypothetical protein